MENFSAWNTRGVSLERALEVGTVAEESRDFSPRLEDLTVGMSSGTCGGQGVFLVSDRESALWAGTVLARAIHCWDRPHRIAFFMRADSRLYQRASNPVCRVEFFDTQKAIEFHLERLEKLNPTILVAPPLVLRSLCPLAPKIKPSQVISVADVLDTRDRQLAESTLGKACDEIYQATEGFLACTCPYGNLHWNEDALIVEKQWLDETSYHPVISDFRRTTQPVIRYKLEDIIQVSRDPCPCGSVFERISKISGRADEILRLNSPEGEVPVLPDFVRRAVCSAIPLRTEYRVVQCSPILWEIHLDTPESFCQVSEALASMCKKMGANSPEMVFRQYVPPPPLSKGRRVVCRS
jgi:putative adenylate-forming enzyme